MIEKLEALCKGWHEAGRAAFNKRCPNIPTFYDKHESKKVIEKKKYYYLDEGTSGVYMVEKSTGDIYRFKAYGQVNKAKFVGHVDHITGEDLLNYRWC